MPCAVPHALHAACEVVEILAIWAYSRSSLRGQVITLADPSGGRFTAAGYFDRLVPVSRKSSGVLARVDPYGEAIVPSGDMAALASEVALLLTQVRQGPERRGLLRLQALALAGQAEPDAVLRFTGD
jgi:hypothetical protein